MLIGKFIAPHESVNVFCAHKEFHIDSIKPTKLKITALGLFFVNINGRRVGDEYLMPGWTVYNKTLQVVEYDITEYLAEGKNIISITVGEGWYRGRLILNDAGRVYGDKTAVCADICYGEKIISTDESWKVTDSVIRFSSLYDGETVDHTYSPKTLETDIVDFDKSVLRSRVGEPVRTVARLTAVKVFSDTDGNKVYDFGQNIAGVAEITTPVDFKGTITLRFAEILIDGKFYTDNLRSAKATDTYTIDGRMTVSPEFTYHGFRYVKVIGADLPIECITALVMHTDLRRTGYISCGNKKFQRLMDNVLWGMRGNFVDIPTDCPQRDERLGWTGDINVFTDTAAFLYDISAFMKKWLNDVRNEQDDKGRISRVVPNVFPVDQKRTSAMWCDCIVMIPWKLYGIYGDLSFLSDNYDAMKRYICAKEDTCVNGLIATGAEYGDWLALDNEVMLADDWYGRTDKYFVANALYSHCLKIMADTAIKLNDPSDVKIYTDKYKKHLRALRREYFTGNGGLCYDTVTAQVLALQFGLVERKYKSALAKRLNDNVIRHRYTVTTGFVGTAYLLFALADNGYFDTASRVLMNEECPGWLYEVNSGATTVWERWNSLTPDGKPHSAGMNSYNHYAYGSVADFVVKRIAGIEPVTAGYKAVEICPRIVKDISDLAVEYDSPAGMIKSAYVVKNNEVEFTVEIPAGIQATVVLPNGSFKMKHGKIIKRLPINSTCDS